MSSATAKQVRPGATLGVVLAGGAGSRLGGAKAMVELAGRPLISYPLAALEAAGLEPLVVAKPDTELPRLDCRVLREPPTPRHPLCGILAALRVAPAIVVVGCDMPFADPALLAHLAAAPGPLVVPEVDGAPEPLMARYDAALIEPLDAEMARQAPLRAAIERLHPRLLSAAESSSFGDPRRIFFNVNSREDLARAERVAGEVADR
jgi:molybdopterin-guanine dinucleotide biosynthesis protein A